MKLILDKVKFYLPVFIALILSIVIFRVLFKKYVAKPKTKTVEGFEEEMTSMTILNELRTLLMNNETEYQNRMNNVLEKIVALEVQIRNEKMQQNEETPVETTTETPVTTEPTTAPATTTPTTAPATTTPTTPPATTAPTTPPATTAPTTPPKPPVNPPAQLNDDEDSDVESNVSDDEEEDISEPFVDGITSCATANCYMI